MTFRGGADALALRRNRAMPASQVAPQVRHSLSVGGGLILHLEFIVVGQAVGDLVGELAGIALFAVGAHVREDGADGVLRLDRLGLPDDLVESLQAAVQVVGAVVDGQRIFLAVEGELALGDAVGVAADGGAEVRRGTSLSR